MTIPNPNRAREEAAGPPGTLASPGAPEPVMTPNPNRAREEAAESTVQGPLPDGRGSASGPLPDGRGSEGGNWPLAYLITFPTCGTWLHGDARGSVDRDHNIPGTPMLDEDEQRRSKEQRRLKRPHVLLDARRRAIVHRTILEVADHRDWTVHTLNVRTNHVRVVVGAPETPERVMNTLKSWSTRRMVEAGVLAPGTKAWVRHGSTRYLWRPDQLEAACQYVCEDQGADLDGAV